MNLLKDIYKKVNVFKRLKQLEEENIQLKEDIKNLVTIDTPESLNKSMEVRLKWIDRLKDHDKLREQVKEYFKNGLGEL